MWKWIKDNAIDRGMPLEKVHEEFNNHYFNGSLSGEKAGWINEFLAARKTPFKRLSDAAWAKQARRRAIQQQAKHSVTDKNADLLQKGFNAVIAGPRYVAVGGGLHGFVFPFTHGGALLLNPTKWHAFARMVVHTWKNASPAEAERLRDTMARSPRFTMAQRSGLDLSTHGSETGGGNLSARTWGALVETRYRLWDAAMERHTNPAMSQEDTDSIGKELAVWANHATGSGQGVFTNKYISPAFFGPKLAQSYWNRLVGDPFKTLRTWANWSNATEGEKVVSMHRLKGAITAASTYTGMLLANQALLAATNQKDKINWSDPSQSDWLAFKYGGFRWGLPGAMHSEINLIGQIVAAQSMKAGDLAKVGISVPKGAISTPRLMSLREEYVARQLFDYAQNKATPAYKIAKDLITGHDWEKRPLPFPWVTDKGDAKHPPVHWDEYAASKAPIFLSAGAGYVYDQLRHAGASVKDASMWMRAAMVSGVSFLTGIDPKAVKDPDPHRTRNQAQVGH